METNRTTPRKMETNRTTTSRVRDRPIVVTCEGTIDIFDWSHIGRLDKILIYGHFTMSSRRRVTCWLHRVVRR